MVSNLIEVWACYELMPMREFHTVRFRWKPHRFKFEGLFFKNNMVKKICACTLRSTLCVSCILVSILGFVGSHIELNLKDRFSKKSNMVKYVHEPWDPLCAIAVMLISADKVLVLAPEGWSSYSVSPLLVLVNNHMNWHQISTRRDR